MPAVCALVALFLFLARRLTACGDPIGDPPRLFSGRNMRYPKTAYPSGPCHTRVLLVFFSPMAWWC